MKIKLTLLRSGTPSVDLVTTVDSATTVGDLANHLLRADPNGRPLDRGPRHGEPTLALVGGDQRALDPRLRVGDSGLRSGATIAISTSGTAYADPGVASAAVVEIASGPDAGRQFTLHRGSSVIGREPGCEVRLTDPMVSRQHARLNISDIAEIIDLGSANGVQSGAATVSRSVLRPGDKVGVGDTELTVRVLHASHQSTDGATVAFVRSPRLDPRYEGVELVAPEPPQAPRRQRFPVVPLLAPMVMGAVLYLITRSLTSLAFVALSPLMIIGYAVESILAGKSEFKRALKVFRADVDDLTAEAVAVNEREAAARDLEHPSLAECVAAVRAGGPLLWTRRPGDPGFTELRLGTGPRQARNTISLPDLRRFPRDLAADLSAVAERFAVVQGVPVVATPSEHGTVGVAGPRHVVLDAARALVVQIAALHSPAELVLTGFASSQSAPEWDWLKWLPHTTSAHSPIGVRHLVSDGAGANLLMSELEDLLAKRADGTASSSPVVVVLVEDDVALDRSRLVELAERGWPHGIQVVWLALDIARLPAACRTFVNVERGGASGAAGYVHSGERIGPVAVELLDAATALDVARALSPLVDTGARVDDDSDLPRAISLLTIPEPALVASGEAVLERWQENRSIITGPCAPPTPWKQAGTLRAVVGKSAAGAHALDLRADGPHALVGGTTGSGKSELLQSWILAMAVAHSPQRLTFLLVDYKGGSAFREFVDLPHTVGLVTDLSPHLVRRSLVSLSAELKYREELFAKHRVKDLVELEKQGSVAAPPSLVIVVDEFAALVKELPEFVDGVVNVAQRGRSLGVHLILATQRPAGVIKDNLRANTNLRLALRTADDADSVDVLGSPQAAYFDPALPGRAVSKTGPGRLVPFQAGYAGGWTSEIVPPPEIFVEELRFGAGTVWDMPAGDELPVAQGPTDISRMVRSIHSACVRAQITKPRKPWLPELSSVYDLARLPVRNEDDPREQFVFGVQDNPDWQAQPIVSFRPDLDGNLAVYGTGGTGKSTMLRTFGIAAGYAAGGGPCHVYGLDFGARGLAMLEGLPHVGSIIAGSDHERVSRLLSWLRQLVDERAVRYSGSDAGTIAEYRALPGAAPDPRVLLLLDGVAAFRQAYEVGDRARWFDALVGIANDGRQVGVHVLMSADRPAAVPSALASAVQTRIALRMADDNDYALMGLPNDVLKPTSPPGRGLLRGAEIQVAMLGTEPDVGSQASRVRQLGESMFRRGITSARPIERLADKVSFHELPKTVDSRPVLGLASDTLRPHAFEPRGTFLVCGPPGSGRTTTVHAVAAALRRFDPTARLHYFGNKRSRLASLGLWDTSATSVAEAADVVAKLADDLPLLSPEQVFAVVIESVAEFANSPADAPLLRLGQLCLNHDKFVLAEGEAASVQSSMGLIGMVKSGRAGVALAPDTSDGPTAFRTNFPPRLNRADFPPGRALHVVGGKTAVVQIGLPDD